MYFVRVASTVGQDISLIPIRFAGTGDMLVVTREMSSILDSEEALENNGSELQPLLNHSPCN